MANAYAMAGDNGQFPVKVCAISWPAIFAGATAAIGISVVLLILGTGLGLTSLAPWTAPDTVASVTLKAVIWLIVMQWFASAFGGFIAGRLRNNTSPMNGDEVFFRDSAHGFLSWAVATIFTIAFFAGATTSLVSGTAKTAAFAGGGAAMHAAAMPGMTDRNSYLLDVMLRPNTAPANGGNMAEHPQPEVRPEMTRIVATGLKNGQFPEEDKAYMAQVVASRANISVDEARARIDTMIAQANQGAEEARKAAAKIAIFLALSMLVGAFVASVAAICGGRHRDL